MKRKLDAMSAVKHNETDDAGKAPAPLDEGDISVLKTYGKQGFYPERCTQLEEEIQKQQEIVNKLVGVRESDTGLVPPSQWDLSRDKQMLMEEAPLLLGHCTKIIPPADAGGAKTGDALPEFPKLGDSQTSKYVIKVPNMARFVVGLGEKVAPAALVLASSGSPEESAGAFEGGIGGLGKTKPQSAAGSKIKNFVVACLLLLYRFNLTSKEAPASHQYLSESSPHDLVLSAEYLGEPHPWSIGHQRNLRSL